MSRKRTARDRDMRVNWLDAVKKATDNLLQLTTASQNFGCSLQEIGTVLISLGTFLNASGVVDDVWENLAIVKPSPGPFRDLLEAGVYYGFVTLIDDCYRFPMNRINNSRGRHDRVRRRGPKRPRHHQ